MRKRTSRRLVAAIACLGLVAAACGDDDDDTDTDTDTEEEAPEDDAPEDEPEETDPPDDEPEETDPPDDEPEETDPPDDGDDAAPVELETDIGVTDDTITIGLLADLSGAFAPLVIEIVEAQEAYWEKVNDEGGIAGRQVEVLVEDNAYDVATHQEKYAIMRDRVVMLSQSTGSPMTASVQPQMVEDDLAGIALSWYSAWWDPEFGQNVFPTYTTYCLESMNAIEWLHTNRDVETIAIASFPGEYGGDGAAGALMAAEELGLDVVWDGTGQVTPATGDNPNPDQSAAISQIVANDPDLVWFVGNPATLVSTMAGAVGQGFSGIWSGNSPSYSFKLLGTDAAELLDEYFIASTYIVTWGADVPGMEELLDTMAERRPNLEASDVYILGWTEAQAAHQILEQAAANGDMTRAGVVAAAEQVEVDFEGLAPNQTWAGEPDDYLVRESYIYDVNLDAFNPGPVSDPEASTGWELLEGPYAGDLVTNYQWDGPCFEG